MCPPRVGKPPCSDCCRSMHHTCPILLVFAMSDMDVGSLGAVIFAATHDGHFPNNRFALMLSLDVMLMFDHVP